MARDRLVPRACQARASQRARRPRRGRSHNLPGELIISLTSYPARFGTLHLTLGCLLDQSIKADRTILWVAHDDVVQLPAGVRELERHGLEIRSCDDLRSFKKLVPALEEFPDAYIATADDDLYYKPKWLEALVEGAVERTIVCHRAHRPKRYQDGLLKRYLEWEFDVQDAAARVPNADIMATSGAGALYPPGSLHPVVTDRATFLSLCPTGDDLWYFWCARKADTLHKKVGSNMRLMMWPGSQESWLWGTNMAGGNDRMIAALEAEFGRP